MTQSDEEEETTNFDTLQSRSPKRQSSTVYERVKTKLSRSFSFATCASLHASPSITNNSTVTLNKSRRCSEKENLKPKNLGLGDPSHKPLFDLKQEKTETCRDKDLSKLTPQDRRCKSELSSPSNPELMNEYISKRCNKTPIKLNVNIFSSENKMSTTSKENSSSQSVREENIDSSEATNAQQIVTAGQNVEVSALKCDKCSLSSNTLKKNDCLPCDCKNVILDDQKSEGDRHCKNLMDESQLNGDFQLITDSSVNSITNVNSSHNEIDLNDETNQINPTDTKF